MSGNVDYLQLLPRYSCVQEKMKNRVLKMCRKKLNNNDICTESFVRVYFFIRADSDFTMSNFQAPCGSGCQKNRPAAALTLPLKDNK